MKNLSRFCSLLLMAAYVSSCAAYFAARQTKKDNEAISYAVTHKKSVMKPVADIWNSLNPVDQKVIYIKGKDSIRIDSIPYDKVRDSEVVLLCPSVNFDSLKKVWTRIIYHNSVDTFVTPDTGSLRRIYVLQSNLGEIQGKYDQQITEVQFSKTKNSKLTLWIIALSISLLVIIALVIYKTIKKI